MFFATAVVVLDPVTRAAGVLLCTNNSGYSPLSVQSQDCEMGNPVITVNYAVVIQAIESNNV